MENNLPDRSAYPALPTENISYDEFLRRNTATGKLKVQGSLVALNTLAACL